MEQGDVAARLLRGREGPAAGPHALGEVEELLLERLLHRSGHVLRVGLVALHAFHDGGRRHVPEERRREDEPHAVGPGVVGHRLLVVGEIGEVVEGDGGADARGVAEDGQHALATGPHVGEEHLGGIARQPAEHVDVVDEGREEVVGEDPPLERGEVSDRLADEAVLLLPEARARRLRDVGEPADVVVLDLVGFRGVEDGDLDGLEVAEALDDGQGVAEGRVVALHVGDHADGAGRPLGAELSAHGEEARNPVARVKRSETRERRRMSQEFRISLHLGYEERRKTPA